MDNMDTSETHDTPAATDGQTDGQSEANAPDDQDDQDDQELSPAELAIAAASLVPLTAPSPDTSACSVAGVEYAVSDGIVHVEPAHVDALLAHGFSR